MLPSVIEQRRFAVRQSAALALFAAAAIGCKPSLETHFRDRAYDWPLHWERDMAAVVVASDLPQKHIETCVSAPDRAPFLRSALSGVRQGELHRIARRYCNEAKSWAFVAPFLVTSHHTGAEYLAMHVECYGSGPLPAGMPPREAQSPMRSLEVDRALDGWKVRDIGDHWIKWNIALFRVSDGATVFDRVLGRYAPDVEHQRIIPEYTDPLVALEACGR